MQIVHIANWCTWLVQTLCRLCRGLWWNHKNCWAQHWLSFGNLHCFDEVENVSGSVCFLPIHDFVLKFWNLHYFHLWKIYEVRDLFPWEMLTKTAISCFLNVEKNLKLGTNKLKLDFKLFTEDILSTQQYSSRNRPVKSTPIWRKMTCNCT